MVCQELNVVSVVEMNQYNSMCMILMYFLSALIELGFEFLFRHLKTSFIWQNRFSSSDYVFENLLSILQSFSFQTKPLFHCEKT